MTTTEAFEVLMPEPAFKGLASHTSWPFPRMDFYTAEQMRAMFDAATERAAKLVEDTDVVEVFGSNSYYCQLGDASATRAACAAAIRARDEGVRG